MATLRELVFSERGPLQFTREYDYTVEPGSRRAVLTSIAGQVADLFGAFLELDAHTPEVVASFRNDYRTLNTLWINTGEERREEHPNGFTVFPWVHNPSIALGEDKISHFKSLLRENIESAANLGRVSRTYTTSIGSEDLLAQLLEEAEASYVNYCPVIPIHSHVSIFEICKEDHSRSVFTVRVGLGCNRRLF